MPAPICSWWTCPARRVRRGSVYVLALGAATLVTIAGLSVIAITRAQGRMADAERDSAEAGLAAQSGIELASAWLGANTDWRTRLSSGTPLGPVQLGRARVAIVVADAADADLANNPSQPVRVTAVAAAGGSTRALSATLAPVAGAPAPALNHAAFAGGTLTIDTTGTLAAGSVASRTGVVCTVNLESDVTAPSVSSSRFINGRVTTGPAAAPPMPSSAAWDSLRPIATDLPFSSLPSGKLDRLVLGPGRNPLGPSNPRGVYHISVPSDKLLEITRCRLNATLLITLTGNAGVKLVDEVLWESPRADQPSLLVSGRGSQGVVFEASGSRLREHDANRNFNPPGTPYDGSSDGDQSDEYPNALRGVFHILHANTSVTLGKETSLSGSLIAAGTIRIEHKATLSPSAALLATPPAGYAGAVGPDMLVVPGSYRWEVEPAAP